MKQEQGIAYLLFILASVALLLTAVLGSSMGEGGDSTLHYLYARYAFSNPALLLNHWAKPFFTLVTSVFAMGGFTSMKVFNVLCAIGSAWLCMDTARINKLKYWHFTGITLLMAPLFFPVMLSGLTEPFSALILMASIRLWFGNKKIAALLLISFMPFVRSEGLIVAGVFALLLLWRKEYKLLPWLAAGHLIYSLAGWPYYDDVLWVFTKIPYASATSPYGSGPWTHFILQLYFCLAPVSFAGFMINTLFSIWKWKPLLKEKTDELFLIQGICWLFIAAHSSFWALGIFNSMGLNRVLVTIFPLAAYMCWQGFEMLLQQVKTPMVAYLLLAAIIVFPFLDNPASTRFAEGATIREEQQFVKEVLSARMMQKYDKVCWFCADPNLAMFTNRNPFDANEWILAHSREQLNALPDGSAIVYDGFLMPTETGITLEQLRADTAYAEDTAYTVLQKRKTSEYAIFVKR